MVERPQNNAVAFSEKLYRHLLAAYPKKHRNEYGPAMAQLFRDQCRDAWGEKQNWGLIKLWLRVLPDLLKTSIAEHLTLFDGRKSMLDLFHRCSTLPLVFRTTFVIVFLLVFGTSALLTFLTPNSYFSTARVRVERNASSNSRDLNFLQTEFEMIRSRSVLGKVVANLNLDEVWGKMYAGGNKLSTSDSIDMLRHALNLYRVRNTSLVEIRVYSTSPDLAAEIANAIAESYRDFCLEEAQREQMALAQSALPMRRVVEILDDAIPNPRAVKPNIPLNLLLGALKGILWGTVVGAGITGIRLWWRRSRGRQNSAQASAAVG